MPQTLRRYDKWIVLLLCVFLGRWGVHRLYTGKIGTGLLFLVAGCSDGGFWGPATFLWLYDIAMIVTDRYRDGNGLLLEGARPIIAPVCYR